MICVAYRMENIGCLREDKSSVSGQRDDRRCHKSDQAFYKHESRQPPRSLRNFLSNR